MKKSVLFGLFVFAALAGSGFAQVNLAQPGSTRSRIVDTKSDTKKVIVTNTMPPVQPISTPTPAPLPKKTPNVVGQDPPVPPSAASNLNYNALSFAQITPNYPKAEG